MRVGVFGQERGEISAFLYGKECGGNAEKMRMGVFGQERGEISAFLYGKKCGENADGSIRTGTWRNLRILIWKEMRRKCGWEYSDWKVEKSPRSYMEKNAEEMRMGVFGQEYGEISALYPHFSHNAENISAFPVLRIPAIMRRITWRIMRRRTRWNQYTHFQLHWYNNMITVWMRMQKSLSMLQMWHELCYYCIWPHTVLHLREVKWE